MRRTLRPAAILAGLVVLVLALAVASAADPPLPGKAAMVLAPRFFPGWQARDVCHPFVVVEAPGRYRMYYSGSGAEQCNESVWDQRMTGCVTSADAIDWRFPDTYEPVLAPTRWREGELLEPEALAARFDSVEAIGACVIRDGGGWKCWYAGWSGGTEHLGGGLTRKVGFRIGLATSPDGLAWTKAAGAAGAGAVLGLGGPGEPDAKGASGPHVIVRGGTCLMWYEGFDGDRWTLLHATSPDGLSWTRRGPVLGPAAPGGLDELGRRNPLVLERKGRRELWYQGRSRSSPAFHVLRAVSPDGLVWTAAPGEVVLHPDPPVSGDEEVLAGSAIVLEGGAVRVFFARQVTTTRTAASGGAINERSFHIYSEVVDP